jgi:hypothetical protein
MLSAVQTASEIKRIINGDPTILESDHIHVSAEKKGFLFFKKEEIHIGGSVHHDTDKRKAEDVARHYAGGRQLVSEIKVIH